MAGFTLMQLEAQVNAALGSMDPLSLTAPDVSPTTPLSRGVNGKKFLWDGVTYESREDAQQALEGYEKDGFETYLFIEEDQYLVYTRMLVTQPSPAA